MTLAAPTESLQSPATKEQLDRIAELSQVAYGDPRTASKLYGGVPATRGGASELIKHLLGQRKGRTVEDHDGKDDEPTEKTKVCLGCKRHLPTVRFGHYPQSKDGLHPYCADCRADEALEVATVKKPDKTSEANRAKVKASVAAGKVAPTPEPDPEPEPVTPEPPPEKAKGWWREPFVNPTLYQLFLLQEFLGENVTLEETAAVTYRIGLDEE
jgi:hypothetical protein